MIRENWPPRWREYDVFWSNVAPMMDDRGCWEWMGSLDRTGYGKVAPVDATGKQRPMKAHRKSYETNVGPIPVGLMVLHKCDNRSCVNPNHLYVGTNADNMRDMVERGRHPLPSRSLSDEQVRDVRKRRSQGETLKALAAEYAVHINTVCRAARGKTYSAVSVL